MKARHSIYQFFLRVPGAIAVLLGAVMVVAGFAANAVFGFSGFVDLKKGPISECLISDAFGIYVKKTQGEGSSFFIDLKKKTLAKQVPETLFSSIDLLVTLNRFIPHAQQRLKALFEEKATLLSPGGVPSSLVLKTASYLDPVLWNLNAVNWQMAALKIEELGIAVAELSMQKKGRLPLFTLIEDGQEKEYVLMLGKGGETSLSSLESHFSQSIVAIDEGKGGYAAEIPVPSGYVDEPYPGAFYLRLQSVPKSLSSEGVPCIYVQFSQGGQEEVVPLVYDPTASSYAWAALGGKYLARFQPRVESLPFAIENYQLSCEHTAGSHSSLCQLSLQIGTDRQFSIKYGDSIRLGGYRLKWASTIPRLEVDYSPARKGLVLPGFLAMATGLLFTVLFPKRKNRVATA